MKIQTLDDALMLESIQGPVAAFERLVRRWEERMFNYFVRCTGDLDAAEDLRQELFFKLYLKRKTYKPNGCFKPWLYRIATNLIFDRGKKIRRALFQPFDEFDESCSGLLLYNQQSSVQENAALNELKGRIDTALNRLPEEKRIVIVLHHYENLTCLEISEVLMITLSTVKYRLYKGLDEMRVELKRLGILEESCTQLLETNG